MVVEKKWLICRPVTSIWCATIQSQASLHQELSPWYRLLLCQNMHLLTKQCSLCVCWTCMATFVCNHIQCSWYSEVQSRCNLYLLPCVSCKHDTIIFHILVATSRNSTSIKHSTRNHAIRSSVYSLVIIWFNYISAKQFSTMYAALRGSRWLDSLARRCPVSICAAVHIPYVTFSPAHRWARWRWAPSWRDQGSGVQHFQRSPLAASVPSYKHTAHQSCNYQYLTKRYI